MAHDQGVDDETNNSQEQEVNLQLAKDVEQRLKLFLKQHLAPGLEVSNEKLSAHYDASLKSGVLVDNLTASSKKPSNVDGLLHGTPVDDSSKSTTSFVRVNIELNPQVADDTRLIEDLAAYKKSLPAGYDITKEMSINGGNFPPFDIKEGSYTSRLFNISGDIRGANSDIFVTSKRSDIENGNKPNTFSVFLPKGSYERIKIEAIKGL